MAKPPIRIKDIRLVRALMTLRSIKAEDLALHAGVQLENLNAWLEGTNSALAHRSYVSVLSYLGITKEGLTGGHVQVWTLRAPRQFSSLQAEALKEIAPWLVGGQIAEVTGDFQPAFKKMRAYVIRGKSFKVLVQVTGGMRIPAELESSMMPGIQTRTTSDGKSGVSHVDALYWHALRHSAITPAEFDDIFTGNFNEWSWNDVRLVARERGITPSALARWVLSRDPKDSGALAQLNESFSGEVGVETEPEKEPAPAENTSKPRSPRRADKALMAVPPLTSPRQH